jgi:hypothetical protein
VYGTSYSCCDGYNGVEFSTIVFYGINLGIIFIMFMYESLVGEFVVTICEFDKLGYEEEGGNWVVLRVCVWLETPIRHRMHSRNLVRNWLVCC